MWDTSSIIAAVGAVSAAAGGLLGVLLTKGVDAVLKINKAKADKVMEEKKYEDSQEAVAFQQATAAYEKLNLAYESRISTLESSLNRVNDELKETRKEHVNCVREQEQLRGELKALHVHVDRLWSHDKANKEQVAQANAEIKKLEATIKTPTGPEVPEKTQP